MIEDLLLQKKDIEEDLEELGSGSGDRRRTKAEILLEHLNAINKALGDPTEVQDDLVAYWDEQLERGEMPDLDMTVDELKDVRREEKRRGRVPH